MKRQNTKNQVILSISILVSGREETVEKCIDSLEGLRRRVPCELILTDTGCDARLWERLKQRADKALQFTWCDDFSAARNVGLGAAEGQWFMFMDDDEWFDSTARIEKFFLSGEYRRYESAAYIVRNYNNRAGTCWGDIYLTRMTRRRSDTRFYYPIHESLRPLLDPEKYLDDYVHHYGNIPEDRETWTAKRHRNLKILRHAIEADPHCMKHYLQAVAEYYVCGEREAAGEMADRGVANLDPAMGVENLGHFDGLCAASVRISQERDQAHDAVRKGREYLEKAAVCDLAKASICCDLAIAYGMLGQWRECARYAGSYLQWKEYFTGHKAERIRQETLLLDDCFSDARARRAAGWGFAASVFLGRAGDGEELLEKEALDWWLETVQDWYILATEPLRESWQRDFGRLMDTIGIGEAALGETDQGVSMPRRDVWEKGGRYAHIRQLYGILTSPEEEVEAAAEASAAAASKSVAAPKAESASAPKPAVTPEMEALAAQLKEKVRQLIGQNQGQAALGAIRQLKEYFPGDEELAALEEQCMR